MARGLQLKNGMHAANVLVDLELFLVGLIMAGTMYCDGPQVEDPTADFDLWRVSWDKVAPSWDLATQGQCWVLQRQGFPSVLLWKID